MFKNEFGQVRSGWLIAFAGLLVFLGQGIFTFIGSIFASMIDMSTEQADKALDLNDLSPWSLVLTQGAGTLGGIVAALIAYRIVHRKNSNDIKVQGPLFDMVYGLLLGAGAMTVAFFLLQMTNQITLVNTLSSPQFSYYTFAFAVIFILTGFFEEIFFRGYVMQILIERRNKRWLVYMISAVIFGFAHLTNPDVSIIGIINIILVGFLFAYMFEKTKSLMLPIGFHITWNFFQGSVYGFEVSGIDTHSLYQTNDAGGNDLITGGTFGIEGGLMATLLIVITFFFTYFYTKKRQAQNGTLFSNGHDRIRRG